MFSYILRYGLIKHNELISMQREIEKQRQRQRDFNNEMFNVLKLRAQKAIKAGEKMKYKVGDKVEYSYSGEIKIGVIEDSTKAIGVYAIAVHEDRITGYAPPKDQSGVKKDSPPLGANVPPPIGIMPRKIWLEHRAIDILDAMRRYIESGKEVPEGWLDELEGLCTHIGMLRGLTK